LRNFRLNLWFLVAPIILAGCASAPPYQERSSEASSQQGIVKKQIPLNPKHGDEIWGGIKVGMTIKEVLEAQKGSKFDDQWSSGGMVGVMAEAGILASNKIKVTNEIKGPFGSKSTAYFLFDEADRCDGVVIATRKNDLPEEALKNYGSIGFYLPEFKEAAKTIIRFAIPELGTRKGPPRLGRDPTQGPSVGIGTSVTPKAGVGIGIPTAISPSSIVQFYDRPGYRSMLSIRTLYLGLYNVYAQPIVFMGIQAKGQNDDIEDVVE
jgi:hypothetical protein